MRFPCGTFGRFCLVGAAGFACDAGLLALLVRTGIGPYAARLVSILVALCLTWVLNRRYAFRVETAPNRREFLAYLGTGWLGAGLNYCVYASFVLLGWPLLPALAFASAAALLFNFGVNRRFTFRARS